MAVTQGIAGVGSDVRDGYDVRDDWGRFEKLERRKESDPIELCPRVMERLDTYFSMRSLTYLPGQRELLAQAAKSILQAVPGTAAAIPFQPGLGKSTLIRALLEEFSLEFLLNTPIAQTVGGMIVVVEKTAEAEELESLCNRFSSDHRIAKAISSPNDYNLAQGKCMNGTAASYQECLGRGCPDYTECPLVQSASQIHDTPMLIMLHARYQRHMEDMTPFLVWENTEGQYSRTLLLVDELPLMIEENLLNLGVINKFESEFDRIKPSFRAQFWAEKNALLYHWNTSIRNPFFKLIKALRKYPGLYGTVSRKELEEAGFIENELQTLKCSVASYAGMKEHPAIKLIDALISAQNAYYAIGQELSLFFPRLRKICGENQPAAFLFSGTASLSPELSQNPDIQCFPDQNLESFRRLCINIQRGDLFNSSKSGLSKNQNLSALVSWLQFILPQIAQHHKKVLAVSYKRYAKDLWHALRDFHQLLIPCMGNDGQAQPLLPYFGGLNGSNLYRESTCVICVGLNRFEPRDYISRALALDMDGRCRDEINTALEVSDGKCRLDCFPRVMDMQDITLARDIVQLVFRSALRNHGEDQPVDLWLLQPPNGVIGYLRNYFGDCKIQEYAELPENCRTAAVAGRSYMGKQTHAGKLLDFLTRWDGKGSLTPAQIRDETGLSHNQFKEAKRHPEVQGYFKTHIHTTGSGKNTRYEKYAVS